MANKTPATNRRSRPAPSSALPSSSPAFGTPVYPPKTSNTTLPKAVILPTQVPPAALRPLAFRLFTKKHSLTLESSALRELAAFIGRHCGSGWRKDGLAEGVLEEVARSWKNRNGGLIVDGASPELQSILKTLEGNMSGGKIIGPGRGLPRGDSFLVSAGDDDNSTRSGLRPRPSLARQDSHLRSGLSTPAVDDDDDDDQALELWAWLKVIDPYSQPRLIYNVAKKHFEREMDTPSLLPPASHKTAVFRNRYQVIHQRLHRNETFHTSRKSKRFPSSSNQERLQITPISNMLGRHDSNHTLLGLLIVLPTGDLAISDLTGTIALDLSQAAIVPHDSAWFCPGMLVLVDGVYEGEEESAGRGLHGSSGVGGTLGGRFQGFFIGQPPCEKRQATLGISGPDGGQDHIIGGGFGWIDFLGVGSERAVGAKMRRLERRLLCPPDDGPPQQPLVPSRQRIILLGEVNLDRPPVLQALRRLLSLYAAEPEGAAPLAFVLAGNFTQQAVMAGGGSGGGSIEYKESFDALASVLSDFPTLLQSSTFVFVPGDQDGWASAFGAGASVPLPQKPVPKLFTSRVDRAFATAKAEAGDRAAVGGSAVWTSNPSRISLFGPLHELLIFRDDFAARLRRNAITLGRGATLETNSDSAPASPSMTPKGVRLPNGKKRAAATDEAPSDDDPPLVAGSAPSADDNPLLQEDAPSDDGPPPLQDAAPSDDELTARKLAKTVLDQGFLAPFRQTIRPVHWDYASSLHLYPLPTAMVLVDTTAPPFCNITYQGCHVMNPASLLVPGRRGVARWIEYEMGGSGRERKCTF